MKKAKPEQFLKDIWPQERDFFERPDRLKYVRKIVQPRGCVFCTAAKKGVSFESLVLYKNRDAMVILNKYPYNTGHLLILPVKHAGDLTKISPKKNQAIFELLRQSSIILKKAYNCPGFNAGLNHGAVAGAGIPEHLHWHIVPRWFGDTNFFPLIAETKVLPETLEQSYSRLRQYFERLDS